jgi:hypothetical protein
MLWTLLNETSLEGSIFQPALLLKSDIAMRRYCLLPGIEDYGSDYGRRARLKGFGVSSFSGATRGWEGKVGSMKIYVSLFS